MFSVLTSGFETALRFAAYTSHSTHPFDPASVEDRYHMEHSHQSTAVPALRIIALGGLAITDAAGPVSGFASIKVQALLVYLAVTGQVHQRTTLAHMFWGDMPDVKADQNLRKALHNLRQLLGSHLTITRTTVAFDRTAPYWLDVEELERASSSTEPESWQMAIDLYGGPFLHGVAVKQADLFNEWAVQKQHQIHDRIIHILEQLADREAALGAYRAALAHTTRLLQLDPWHDQAHHRMLLLLERSGMRHAALEHYEHFKRQIWEDLGLEPAPAMTALYERIALATARRNQPLPNQATAFVGREVELRLLSQRLADPSCRLLTLIGPGGTGKTRLALQAAQLQQEKYIDGVVWIELATVESHDALLSTLAAALDIHLYGGGDTLVQICNALRSRECLLVLDNFEQLCEESLIVSEILSQAPAVRLLVSSRERLGIREEWLFDVHGLDHPPKSAAGAHAGDDATQLFVQSVLRLQHTFTPTPADLEAIHAICRMVEGMPLAIELAAAWSRTFSCAEIAAQIEHSLGFLTTSVRNSPARHRSMLAVFEQSWQLLTPESRRVCMRLAVFRGGFTSEAANEVGAATPPILATLTDKLLLRRTETGRFVFHELLRQYALDQLQADPAAAAAALNQHCEYIARTLLPLGLELKQQRQKVVLARINAEIENVRAAWGHAIVTRNIAAIGMLFGGLLHFYEIRGWFQEATDVLGRALAAVRDPQVDNPAKAFIAGVLLLGQGGFHMRYGHYAQAEQQLTDCISLLTPFQAWREISYARYSLSHAARDRGEYGQAQELLDTCLATFRDLADDFGLRLTLITLGEVETRLGHSALAQQYLLEALALARRYQDAWAISLALHVLAELSQQQGQLDDAERLYIEQTAISAELADEWGKSRALHRLGEVALLRHDYARARDLLTRSRDLHEQIDDRLGRVASLNGLGRLAAATGAAERAQGLFTTAFELAIDAQATPLALAALAGMAAVAAQEHDHATAAALIGFIRQQSELAQETRAQLGGLAEHLEVGAVHHQPV